MEQEAKEVADSVVLEEEIDPNYTPSEEEVVEYAVWLGMDLEKDKDLFWIAREGLMAPLPGDWKPCRTKDTEDIYYFNFSTGESTWDHPCDGHYKKTYEEEKKKKETKLKESSDENRSKARQDVELLLGKAEKKRNKRRDTLELGAVNIPKLGGLERNPLPGLSKQPLRSLSSNNLYDNSNNDSKMVQSNLDKPKLSLSNPNPIGGINSNNGLSTTEKLFNENNGNNNPGLSATARLFNENNGNNNTSNTVVGSGKLSRTASRLSSFMLDTDAQSDITAGAEAKESTGGGRAEIKRSISVGGSMDHMNQSRNISNNNNNNSSNLGKLSRSNDLDMKEISPAGPSNNNALTSSSASSSMNIGKLDVTASLATKSRSLGGSNNSNGLNNNNNTIMKKDKAPLPNYFTAKAENKKTSDEIETAEDKLPQQQQKVRTTYEYDDDNSDNDMDRAIPGFAKSNSNNNNNNTASNSNKLSGRNSSSSYSSNSDNNNNSVGNNSTVKGSNNNISTIDADPDSPSALSTAAGGSAAALLRPRSASRQLSSTTSSDNGKLRTSIATTASSSLDGFVVVDHTGGGGSSSPHSSSDGGDVDYINLDGSGNDDDDDGNAYIHRIPSQLPIQNSINNNHNNNSSSRSIGKNTVITAAATSDSISLQDFQLLENKLKYSESKCSDLEDRAADYEKRMAEYKTLYLTTKEELTASEKKFDVAQNDWRSKLRAIEEEKYNIETEKRSLKLQVTELELKQQQQQQTVTVANVTIGSSDGDGGSNNSTGSSTNSNHHNHLMDTLQRELNTLRNELKTSELALSRSIAVREELQKQLQDTDKLYRDQVAANTASATASAAMAYQAELKEANHKVESLQSAAAAAAAANEEVTRLRAQLLDEQHHHTAMLDKAHSAELAWKHKCENISAKNNNLAFEVEQLKLNKANNSTVTPTKRGSVLSSASADSSDYITTTTSSAAAAVVIDNEVVRALQARCVALEEALSNSQNALAAAEMSTASSREQETNITRSALERQQQDQLLLQQQQTASALAEAKIVQLESAANASAQRIAQLELAAANAATSRQRLESDYAQQRQQVLDLEYGKNSLLNQISMQESNLRRAKSDLNTFAAQSEAHRQLELEKQQLVSRVDALIAENAELRTVVNNSRNEKDSLLAELQTLKLAHDTAIANVISSKNEQHLQSNEAMMELQQSLSSLQAENTKLSANLKQERELVALRDKKIRTYQEEVLQMQRRFDSIGNTTIAATTVNSPTPSSATDDATAAAATAAISAALHETSLALSNSKAENIILTAQLASKEQQLLTESRRNTEAELAQQRHEYEAQLQQQQLKFEQQQMSANLLSQQQMIDNSNNMTDLLRRQLANATADVEALQANVHRLMTEVSSYKDKWNTSETTLTMLRIELQECELKAASTASALATIEQQRILDRTNAGNEDSSVIEQLRNEIHQLQKTLDTTVQQNAMAVNALESKLIAMTRSEEAVRYKLQLKEAEITEAEAKILCLEQELNMQSTSLMQLRQQIQQLEQQLTAQQQLSSSSSRLQLSATSSSSNEKLTTVSLVTKEEKRKLSSNSSDSDSSSSSSVIAHGPEHHNKNNSHNHHQQQQQQQNFIDLSKVVEQQQLAMQRMEKQLLSTEHLLKNIQATTSSSSSSTTAIGTSNTSSISGSDKNNTIEQQQQHNQHLYAGQTPAKLLNRDHKQAQHHHLTSAGTTDFYNNYNTPATTASSSSSSSPSTGSFGNSTNDTPDSISLMPIIQSNPKNHSNNNNNYFANKPNHAIANKNTATYSSTTTTDNDEDGADNDDISSLFSLSPLYYDSHHNQQKHQPQAQQQQYSHHHQHTRHRSGTSASPNKQKDITTITAAAASHSRSVHFQSTSPSTNNNNRHNHHSRSRSAATAAASSASTTSSSEMLLSSAPAPPLRERVVLLIKKHNVHIYKYVHTVRGGAAKKRSCNDAKLLVVEGKMRLKSETDFISALQSLSVASKRSINHEKATIDDLKAQWKKRSSNSSSSSNSSTAPAITNDSINAAALRVNKEVDALRELHKLIKSRDDRVLSLSQAVQYLSDAVDSMKQQQAAGDNNYEDCSHQVSAAELEELMDQIHQQCVDAATELRVWVDRNSNNSSSNKNSDYNTSSGGGNTKNNAGKTNQSKVKDTTTTAGASGNNNKLVTIFEDEHLPKDSSRTVAGNSNNTGSSSSGGGGGDSTIVPHNANVFPVSLPPSSVIIQHQQLSQPPQLVAFTHPDGTVTLHSINNNSNSNTNSTTAIPATAASTAYYGNNNSTVAATSSYHHQQQHQYPYPSTYADPFEKKFPQHTQYSYMTNENINNYGINSNNKGNTHPISLIQDPNIKTRILQEQINKIVMRNEDSRAACEKHASWLAATYKELNHLPHKPNDIGSINKNTSSTVGNYSNDGTTAALLWTSPDFL